jgi:C-terminal processing protease CtpA/Prc
MNNHLQALARGTAFAALLTGISAFGPGLACASGLPAPKLLTAAPTTALSADLRQLFDTLGPQVKLSLSKMLPAGQLQVLKTIQLDRDTLAQSENLDLLVKSLSPKARAVLDQLPAEDRARVLAETQTRFKSYLAGTAQVQLGALPIDKQKEQLAAILSSIAYARADERFNGCNFMLDREAEIAYDEAGVRKLTAMKRQCPIGPKVDLEATLHYVNLTLACALDDPAYTRVMGPQELADMQEELQGKKTAFAGGGIGLVLAADPSKWLPPSAEQLANWEAERQSQQAKLDKPEIDPCTGKPIELTAQEQAELKKEPEKPHNVAFAGIIEHVMKKSPAAKAGFREGDVVIKIGDENVIGQEFGAVVSKLRGDVGKNLTITVKRGDREITKTLMREPVVADTVWSRDLGNGIYAIVITSFERQNTAGMIYAEIQKLGRKARGYVFVVRSNPGGLFDESIIAASWFIHDGVILTQRERVPGDPADPHYINITWKRVGSHVVNETVDEKTGKVLDRHNLKLTFADDKTGKVVRVTENIPFIGDKPAAIIANGGSASSAEIFTGAMGENYMVADKKNGQKAQGAIFIGDENTVGKFIGQRILPGPHKTGIKGTIFRYYSPLGEWLGDAWKHRIGLTPRIKVKQPANAIDFMPTDAQMNFAKAYLLSKGELKAPPYPHDAK